MLQIENYMVTNYDCDIKKVCVDYDYIWEIANSIRWLNQTFRDKFKIDKFLFGEIYPNYYSNAPDFILSLMEELGYDKEETNDSPPHSPSPIKSPPLKTTKTTPSSSSKNFSNESIKENVSVCDVRDKSLTETETQSNTVVLTGRINHLFEDDDDQFSQSDNINLNTAELSVNNDKKDDDILNDYIKKKKPL
jgi:hypothetical protein